MDQGNHALYLSFPPLSLLITIIRWNGNFKISLFFPSYFYDFCTLAQLKWAKENHITYGCMSNTLYAVWATLTPIDNDKQSSLLGLNHRVYYNHLTIHLTHFLFSWSTGRWNRVLQSAFMILTIRPAERNKGFPFTVS